MNNLRQAAQQVLDWLYNNDVLHPTKVSEDLRAALAEPEQSFEDEQRVINADEHRRANALEQQAEPDRRALQAEGKHPAPCARHCEAKAFEIEIRMLKAALRQEQEQESQALIERDTPDPDFNAWWNADEDEATNPFHKDRPIYWAWAGWKAGMEAGAVICDNIASKYQHGHYPGAETIADECAAAIRARGTT